MTGREKTLFICVRRNPILQSGLFTEGKPCRPGETYQKQARIDRAPGERRGQARAATTSSAIHVAYDQTLLIAISMGGMAVGSWRCSCCTFALFPPCYLPT